MKENYIQLSLLFAVDSAGNFGHSNGRLPWHFPEDLQHFKKITSEEGVGVVMGSKTWNSLPVNKVTGEKLPGRIKFVYTYSNKEPEYKTIFLQTWSPKELCNLARQLKLKKLYIIGGANFIHTTMMSCNSAIVTHIHGTYDADIKFYLDSFNQIFKPTGSSEYLAPGLEVVEYKNSILNLSPPTVVTDHPYPPFR